MNPTDELRIEMVELIGANYMNEMEADELGAEVLFTVNNKEEIIILSVDSDNALLESYLKNKLNYKKVNHRPGKNGEIYLLKVKSVTRKFSKRQE